MRNTQQPKIASAIRSLATDPTPPLHRHLPHIDGIYTRCIVAGGVEPYSNEVFEHLRELSTIHGVRIFAVSGEGRSLLYSGLIKNLESNPTALRQVELLRQRRRDSYGVATNDAYLAAKALGVDMVQFMDDDTGPIVSVDLIARHRDIICGREAVAVTGPYLGTPWLDTAFFPRPAHGICFAAEFMRHLPSRRPIQANATSLSAQVDETADYLIGGNNMVARELFHVLPCCAALETIGTDDIFYGAMASSLFPGRVRRSSVPVLHFHAGGRKSLPAVRRYFRNLSRAVAFFAFLDDNWLKYLTDIALSNIQDHQPAVSKMPLLQEGHAREAVDNFFAGLKRIRKEAGNCLPHPVRVAIDALSEGDSTVLEGEDVIETARASLAEYAELLAVWPVILAALDDTLSEQFQAVAVC
jgi:hypothetical protein